jgi:hypothetical protein
LLRELCAEEREQICGEYKVSADDARSVLDAEGFCGGYYADFATALAIRACWINPEVSDNNAGSDPARLPSLQSFLDFLQVKLSESELSLKLRQFAELEDSYQQHCQAVCSDELLEKTVEANQVDWITIRSQCAVFPAESMAREAAMCVREDGVSLAEIADQAGAGVNSLCSSLEEIEDNLGSEVCSAVRGAREGDLVGPLSLEDNYLLVEVVQKMMPVLTDPDIRRRATHIVLEAASEREISQHVTWTAPWCEEISQGGNGSGE